MVNKVILVGNLGSGSRASIHTVGTAGGDLQRRHQPAGGATVTATARSRPSGTTSCAGGGRRRWPVSTSRRAGRSTSRDGCRPDRGTTSRPARRSTAPRSSARTSRCSASAATAAVRPRLPRALLPGIAADDGTGIGGGGRRRRRRRRHPVLMGRRRRAPMAITRLRRCAPQHARAEAGASACELDHRSGAPVTR